jgi:hypothetical protein
VLPWQVTTTLYMFRKIQWFCQQGEGFCMHVFSSTMVNINYIWKTISYWYASKHENLLIGDLFIISYNLKYVHSGIPWFYFPKIGSTWRTPNYGNTKRMLVLPGQYKPFQHDHCTFKFILQNWLKIFKC